MCLKKHVFLQAVRYVTWVSLICTFSTPCVYDCSTQVAQVLEPKKGNDAAPKKMVRGIEPLLYGYEHMGKRKVGSQVRQLAAGLSDLQ